jgi:myo-inositol-1(or 4)-monophosphatase
MKPTLLDLEILARQAGAILRANYGRGLQISHKSLLDLVTEADHRSEAFLLGEVQHRFPDQRVISEESGGLPGSEGQVWYIDPLDGTVNYAHGIPIFAVSIGYAEAGEMRLGVVYDPMREECFTAEWGQGAFLNGQRLQVAQAEDLDHSLLVTGFPYDIRSNPENNLNYYTHFALRSQGVRRLGSAALDLCYVAAGRFDGYWELRLKAWDVAAGGLIAAEAGARVTRLDGSLDYLEVPLSILAANPTVHALLLKEFQRHQD